MDLWRDLLFVLWVFTPAGIANMTPILAAKVPALRRWTAPIDGGRSFRGKRIFGNHKTWRGLVTGMVVATLILGLQQVLVANVEWFDWVSKGFSYDFAIWQTLLMGSLFAVGALGGDALKSFFKRQLGVAPGHSWPPFDQIDYVLGGAIAIAPFLRFTLLEYVLLVVVWGGISLFASWLGYLTRFKESPF